MGGIGGEAMAAGERVSQNERSTRGARADISAKIRLTRCRLFVSATAEHCDEETERWFTLPQEVLTSRVRAFAMVLPAAAVSIQSTS